MSSGDRALLARELLTLDKATWTRLEGAMIGLIGKDKIPLVLRIGQNWF